MAACAQEAPFVRTHRVRSASTSDLHGISAADDGMTSFASGACDSAGKSVNPNHFGFATAIELEGAQEDLMYEHALSMQWDAEFAVNDAETLDSHKVTCPSSGTVWRLRLEPADVCGRFAATSPPTAKEMQATQRCFTVRVVAVELFNLKAVLGFFSVEWEVGKKQLQSGGAIWRNGDARGHVLQMQKLRHMESHKLSLKVHLQFTRLDLGMMLVQVEPPNWTSISVAAAYGQPSQVHKMFCLTVHWKIKGWSNLPVGGSQPGAVVLRSPCFGLKREELLFRLLLYPAGGLLDSKGTLSAALHTLHLPSSLRSNGLRVQFALAIRLSTMQSPGARGKVRRTDRVFHEGCGWSMRFGQQKELQSMDSSKSSALTDAKEYLSVRAELRFRLLRDA